MATKKRLTPKQRANRKARALESLAASVDKQGALAPKIDANVHHRIADNLRALAASVRGKAG